MGEAQKLLLDEQRAQPLPSLTIQDGRIPQVEGMAVAFVGMRRTGKRCRMFQEMHRLVDRVFVHVESDVCNLVHGRSLRFSVPRACSRGRSTYTPESGRPSHSD